MKFQVLVSILHVDDAKRVEGTVIEAAAYLYAGSFFCFWNSGERKGELKNKCCADMVFRIVYNDGEDVGSANAFVMRV